MNGLLTILLVSQVSSELSASDPSSPESKFIKLLLGPDPSTQVISSTPASMADSTDHSGDLLTDAAISCSRDRTQSIGNSVGGGGGTYAFKPSSTLHSPGMGYGCSSLATGVAAAAAAEEEHLNTVENLLLRGNREEALRYATSQGLWPVALILGGVCGKEAYQDVVRRYADASFGTHGSERLPLHLMCLLYSNQAEGTLKYGGKSLSGTSGNISGAFATSTANYLQQPSLAHDQGSWLLKDWKRIVVSIIANKSGHWSSLLRLLAERLRKEKQVLNRPYNLLIGIYCVL